MRQVIELSQFYHFEGCQNACMSWIPMPAAFNAVNMMTTFGLPEWSHDACVN